jgi:proteasome lid subunit RPN8/RPN11
MLILSPKHRDTMIAHGRKGLPHEACGIFAGENQGEKKIVREVYCLTNIDKSAEHFSIAPEEQFKVIADIRKKGLVLLGNFHTHPETPARPSAEDVRLAFDPALSYVIISFEEETPVLRSFTVHQGQAKEEKVFSTEV